MAFCIIALLWKMPQTAAGFLLLVPYTRGLGSKTGGQLSIPVLSSGHTLVFPEPLPCLTNSLDTFP